MCKTRQYLYTRTKGRWIHQQQPEPDPAIAAPVVDYRGGKMGKMGKWGIMGTKTQGKMFCQRGNLGNLGWGVSTREPRDKNRKKII